MKRGLSRRGWQGAGAFAIWIALTALCPSASIAQDTLLPPPGSAPRDTSRHAPPPVDTLIRPPIFDRDSIPPIYRLDSTAIPRPDSNRLPWVAPGPRVVDEVLISGNERTAAFVIQREMSLRPGEEITQERIQYDRDRIYSLRLFNRVLVSAHPSVPGKAKIMVEVDERWYIFPFPILGIRDRDWSRVFYGVGIMHNNFRGRNEKLFASVVLGYDPSLSLSYRNPFLDESGTWFMEGRLSHSRVRNRSPEVLGGSGDYEERHYLAGATAGMRLGTQHSVSASLGYRLVHVPTRSPLATNSADGRDQFPTGGLAYMYDTRDLSEYPSRGSRMGASVTKWGWPGSFLDFTRSMVDLRHYLPLPGGFTLAGRVFSDLAAGGRIPSYGRVYFGYGERIRGHFDTVIEGENLAGASAELHLPLLQPVFVRVDPLPSGFDLWRFGIVAALFGDAGTAWFRNGAFSVGDLRKGYGAGIHFLLPYSAVLRLEYAWNERRQGELIVDLGAGL